MKLAMIRVQNFRKLKDIRLDFSDKTTLFVGANNSGKTSAMDALRKFLIKGDNRITLGTKFKGVLDELGDLGYPGVNDPKITIETKLEERTAFDHDSAVHYNLTGDTSDFRLPEKYNILLQTNLRHLPADTSPSCLLGERTLINLSR